MTSDKTESEERSPSDRESEQIIFKWAIKANILFSPLGSPLFHYTSLATFNQILKTRKLWASHFRYLNDVTEFRYAVQIISERIQSRQGEATILQRATNALGNLVPSDLLRGPYVISFSEDGDSLSQWRGYCSHTAGVSMGFNSKMLSGQLSVMHDKTSGNEAVYGYLVQCIYEREEQYALVDQLIDFLLESIKDKDSDDPTCITHSSTFMSILPIIAPAFKDHAFRDEREWRIVVNSTSSSPKNAKFR